MAAKKTSKRGASSSSSGSKKGSGAPGGKKKKSPSARASSSAKKGTTKKSTGRKRGGASAIADELMADDNASRKIAEYGSQLADERATTATQAARVISELRAKKPELIVPLVDKLVAGITSEHKRVVQCAADALPVIARVAPARVARHLDKLKSAFDRTNEDGKDGLVRTFSALCTASVAYQKRLEPVLTKALEHAEGKTLVRWTETVLPALKGEPHARARAVVEDRLYDIDRGIAQQVADILGVKLRPSMF